MRFRSHIITSAIMTATLAGSAGCSVGGNGANAPAPTQAGTLTSRQGSPVEVFTNARALDASKTSLIAMSDAANNVVDVFSPAGRTLATLRGFSEPQGMASDDAGRLYVADYLNNRIAIFRSLTSPPTYLSEPGNFPEGVDAFANGTIVAAANITSSHGRGNVSFFTHGRLNRTISSPTFAKIDFCAFDAKGNLYLDGADDSGNVRLGEIVGGIRGKRIKNLTVGNTFVVAGSVEVTNSGRIVVGDQNGPIYTYNPPVNGNLGNAIATTILAGAFASTFAFTKDSTHLIDADANLGSINEYAYAAGGSPILSIPIRTAGAIPVGIALMPAQMPRE